MSLRLSLRFLMKTQTALVYVHLPGPALLLYAAWCISSWLGSLSSLTGSSAQPSLSSVNIHKVINWSDICLFHTYSWVYLNRLFVNTFFLFKEFFVFRYTDKNNRADYVGNPKFFKTTEIIFLVINKKCETWAKYSAWYLFSNIIFFTFTDIWHPIFHKFV